MNERHATHFDDCGCLSERLIARAETAERELAALRAEIQRINAERSDDLTIVTMAERARIVDEIGEDSRWRARVEPLLRELLEAETQWRAFCQQVADATGNTLYHSHRSAALMRALDDVTRDA
jgi:hypothetical protein